MSECHHFDHGAATGTVTRLAKECPFCRIETLERLLKSVQSDPGNWLHSELLEAIEAAVGPAAGYRSLDDSGVPPGIVPPEEC